jgi:hypothetical protein
VHLGYTGGALSPGRTDWSVLAKEGIKRAFIVADNDRPGRSAVPKIAEQLHMPTCAVQFTSEFPASFDLADPFPDTMFSDDTMHRYYTGPTFHQCLHIATWATDLVTPEKGRPYPVLRDSFKEMWAYVEEIDEFVSKESSPIVRPAAILDRMLAPFSHTSETSKVDRQGLHRPHCEALLPAGCARDDHHPP